MSNQSNKKNTIIIESHANIGMNETVLNIKIDQEYENTLNNSEFIFIIDISYSMRGFAKQIINELIPKVIDNLFYDEDKIFHLITFQNIVEYFEYKKKDFQESKIEACGATNMKDVIYYLKKIFKRFEGHKIINIITLSDGLVHDKEEIKKELEKCIKELEKNLRINSQSISFLSPWTYIDKPDLEILSLYHKLGNVEENAEIIKIKPNDNYTLSKKEIEDYSIIISNKFNKEISGWKLISKNKNLRLMPFGNKYKSLILLNKDNTVFIEGCLNENNKNEIELLSTESSRSVKPEIKIGEKVNQENKYFIYKDTLSKIINILLINKKCKSIIGKNENIEIIEYVRNLENKTQSIKNIKPNNRVSDLLKEINNNENISEMETNELNEFINTQKNLIKKEINEIEDEICEFNNIELKSKYEYIILINYSKFLEQFLNDFIQKIMFGFFEKKNIDKKITIINNKLRRNLKYREFKNHNFSKPSNGTFIDGFENAVKRMTEDPDKEKIYHLYTIFSNFEIDKNDLKRKIYENINNLEKQNIKIYSNLIKLIDNEYIKEKIKLGKKPKNFDDETIICGLLKQITTNGIKDIKPLIIHIDQNDEEKKINDIIELYNNNLLKKN